MLGTGRPKMAAEYTLLPLGAAGSCWAAASRSRASRPWARTGVLPAVPPAICAGVSGAAPPGTWASRILSVPYMLVLGPEQHAHAGPCMIMVLPPAQTSADGSDRPCWPQTHQDPRCCRGRPAVTLHLEQSHANSTATPAQAAHVLQESPGLMHSAVKRKHGRVSLIILIGIFATGCVTHHFSTLRVRRAGDAHRRGRHHHVGHVGRLICGGHQHKAIPADVGGCGVPWQEGWRQAVCQAHRQVGRERVPARSCRLLDMVAQQAWNGGREPGL